VTEDKYDVKRCVEEAAIIVTNNTEPHVSCTITLTSPIMRETSEGGMHTSLAFLTNTLKFIFHSSSLFGKYQRTNCYKSLFLFWLI